MSTLLFKTFNPILKTPIKFILFFLLLLSLSTLHSNNLPQLTSQSLVSLLICSPGSDYQTSYGHSSLRIQDDSLHIDVVFNFGSYNPDQSFLVYKMLAGKVESSLEGEHFYRFAERYKKEDRGINEYFLNLSVRQKQLLWKDLNERLINGERFYKFNFINNNCTTQLKDLLFNTLNLPTEYYQGILSGYSYRDIIYSSPTENCWYYSLLNLLAGPKNDKPLSIYEAAISPDLLLSLFYKMNSKETELIYFSHELFPPKQFKKYPYKHLATLLAFSILIISIVISYFQYKSKIVSNYVWFDRLLFLLNGLIGVALITLIFFSEIELMKPNYNILWLLPTTIVLVCIKPTQNNSFITWLVRISWSLILIFPICAYIAGQHIPIEGYLLALTLWIRLSFYTNFDFIFHKQKDLSKKR